MINLRYGWSDQRYRDLYEFPFQKLVEKKCHHPKTSDCTCVPLQRDLGTWRRRTVLGWSWADPARRSPLMWVNPIFMISFTRWRGKWWTYWGVTPRPRQLAVLLLIPLWDCHQKREKQTGQCIDNPFFHALIRFLVVWITFLCEYIHESNTLSRQGSNTPVFDSQLLLMTCACLVCSNPNFHCLNPCASGICF